MDMKYKVLALDLDGTLTNSQKIITPRTRETLIKAQQKGLKIILASGRPPFGIKPIAEQLELKKYGGYILAFNGGAVIDCSTGKTIMQRTLDTSLYPYLYSKGNTQDFNILSYLGDDIACEDIEDEYVQYEARLNGMGLRKVENFLKEINFPEPKFLIVGNPAKLALLEKELAEHLKGIMNVYRSEPFFLELLPLGIDKACCLDAFLKQQGYQQQDLMACGDGYNDLSMIRYAAMGVAMANAQEEVIRAADYVTLSNDQDGVAEAVEKILLQED